MAAVEIVALEGDQTGQELLEQALRVLDPGVLGLDVEITRFDLSLEKPAPDRERASAARRRPRCARPGSG